MIDKKKKIKKDIKYYKIKSQENLDGWQRAKADYENLKKEMEIKQAELSNFVKANLCAELIPILDNFIKAVEHVPQEQRDENWVTGIFHIQKQLEDFLSANGLEKIKTVGEDFNPQMHEAVDKAKGEKDKVIKEVSSGYKLNGKVIIPAKVIVGE